LPNGLPNHLEKKESRRRMAAREPRVIDFVQEDFTRVRSFAISLGNSAEMQKRQDVLSQHFQLTRVVNSVPDYSAPREELFVTSGKRSRERFSSARGHHQTSTKPQDFKHFVSLRDLTVILRRDRAKSSGNEDASHFACPDASSAKRAQ
jgi:hypothetical protein